MEEVKKIREQIDGWLSFCDRSYSVSTCRMYKCVIMQLHRHIKQNGEKLSAAAIEDFLDNKYKNGGSKRLFNTYRNTIRSFCNWRQRKYDIESPANSIPKIKEGRGSPRVLSPDEYRFIINFVSGMDRDILLFLGGTGLRKSEFAGLQWNDFDLQLKFFRVLGKGNKYRIVPINATVREILLKYKRLPDQPLQISRRYPGPENCSWLCRRIHRKTGMKPFGSHSLRHFFATELIRRGVSIYKVSKILGHASIKITEQCYIHLVPVDLIGETDVLDD